MKYVRRPSRKLAICLALVLTVGGILGNGMTVSAAENEAPKKALKLIDVERDSAGNVTWKLADESLLEYLSEVIYIDLYGNPGKPIDAILVKALSNNVEIVADSDFTPIKFPEVPQKVEAPEIIWDDYMIGLYTISYEQQKNSIICIDLYYNESLIDSMEIETDDNVGHVNKNYAYFRQLNENGQYVIKAQVKHADGSSSEWGSSDVLEYKRPDQALDLIDVKRESDGNVSWKLSDEWMSKYLYYVDYVDSNGSSVVASDAVAAKAISRRPDICAHSSLVPIEGAIVDKEEPTNTSKPATTWEPTTPEEIKSFSYRSSFPVSFTVAGVNDDTISMSGEAQGNLFIEAVESVLGEYTIASTYNIGIDGQKFYETEKEIQMCIKVPAPLANEGRTFKMITVDKSGVPYIFEDLDNSSDTITFTVDKGYAYALCYVDAN